MNTSALAACSLLFGPMLACEGDDVSLGSPAPAPSGIGGPGLASTGGAGAVPSGTFGTGGTSTTAGDGGSVPPMGGAPPFLAPSYFHEGEPSSRSAQLDVLLVVDNSVFMADKQAELAATLPAFLQQLTNPACIENVVLTAVQLNGHEHHDDLQYACVLSIPERDCIAAEAAGRSCECGPSSPDPAEIHTPLCRAPGAEFDATQRFAKAYPGLRLLPPVPTPRTSRPSRRWRTGSLDFFPKISLGPTSLPNPTTA